MLCQTSNFPFNPLHTPSESLASSNLNLINPLQFQFIPEDSKMFSKVIVNLTGISLILYISATPTQLAGRP